LPESNEQLFSIKKRKIIMGLIKRFLFVSSLLCAVSCDNEKVEDHETRTGEQSISARKVGKIVNKERFVDNAIRTKLRRFTPVEIGVEDDLIPKKHRPLLKKVVEAARLIDRLFLVQVARENPVWRAEIASQEEAKNTLAYFDIMYGPWDRLDGDERFWGDKEKPKGVTFYPENLTKKEFETWIEAHPDREDDFKSYFTIIERHDGELQAVPYSTVYRTYLQPAAAYLEEAGALTEDHRLKKYLQSRARAFRDNDYRSSDMDWMDLGDGEIELVIGPYEVYEDELFGYKAAFEAFVALRDPEHSKALAKIKAYLPEMESILPIPEEHKNPNRGNESPISVVDVLFTAGDTRAGVQTLAFNLPNDEVVREKKGSKKVLLKNVSHAKYQKILVPIAEALMDENQVKHVSFEAFFNHTLVHETAHGLGPGKITVYRNDVRTETSVNEELKDLYAPIEEAKADVLGMYLNHFLIEKGMFQESFTENMYASFLGGFFRSVRFGAGEAHGMANVIQFNYFIEKGAITKNKRGRYLYHADKMPKAIEQLANALLMIEALGDYQAAKKFIDEYGTMPQDLKASLDSLATIPTDIRPIYPVEKQLLGW
jgi:hypothetical protein